MKHEFNLLFDVINVYKAPVFICSRDFFIVCVNDFIINNKCNIAKGQHINDVLTNYSIDYLSAFDRVLKGLPFFSTNFEFNFLDTTLCMLPIIENSTTEYVVCILDISGDSSPLLSYKGSISPLISERYRAPVAGIMNVSAILARRFQADEDYKSLNYLNHISHCCYLMLNTSVSVQEYYMLVNNKRELNIKKLVINRFLENICRTLQVLFVNSGYTLELTGISDEDIITEFDEDMVSLALFHIISNSCKFSAKGSTIKVVLTKNNNSVNISISDEGIGIDNTLLSRIFDPFFSISPTPITEDEMGIGLGLPIAKKVIEAHGGQIFVTSEQNKGTTIVVSLPIKSDDSTELTLNSDTTKYITDKFSNVYLIFSEICNIKLY